MCVVDLCLGNGILYELRSSSGRPTVLSSDITSCALRTVRYLWSICYLSTLLIGFAILVGPKIIIMIFWKPIRWYNTFSSHKFWFCTFPLTYILYSHAFLSKRPYPVLPRPTTHIYPILHPTTSYTGLENDFDLNSHNFCSISVLDGIIMFSSTILIGPKFALSSTYIII